jgi:hypothetical protein
MKKLLLSALALVFASSCIGQIVFNVNSPATIQGYQPSSLGVAQSSEGWTIIPDLNNPALSVTGQLVLVDDGTANPTLGCDPLINGGDVFGKIALIDRGTCFFGLKALNAQNEGAIAVVIINNVIGGGAYNPPGSSESAMITIPVVMIPYEAGQELLPNLALGVEVFIGTLPVVDNDMRLIKVDAAGTPGLIQPNALPYYKTPISQIRPWNFEGTVKNIGNLAQTNVTLDVEINSGLFSSSSTGVNVSPDDEVVLTTIGTFTPPAVPANYNVVFNVLANEVDDNPTNNQITKVYEVTEFIYARDNNIPTSTFSLANYNGVGNVFEIYQSAILTGIDVKVSTQSVGTPEVYGSVYKFDAVNNMFTYIAESGYITLTPQQISAGDFITIPMTPPVVLDANDTYIVMVECFSNTTNYLVVSTAGTSAPQTSFVSQWGDWYYLTNTPMVRMNFNCELLPNTPGNMRIVNLDNFSTHVTSDTIGTCDCSGTVQLHVPNNGLVELVDEQGSVVLSQHIPVGSTSTTLSGICSGSYSIIGYDFCGVQNDSLTLIVLGSEFFVSVNSIPAAVCGSASGSANVAINCLSCAFSNTTYELDWNGPSGSGSTTQTGGNNQGGALTATIPGLLSGTYSIDVTSVSNAACNPINISVFIDANATVQDLCVVTVDETTSNHNVIFWEKPVNIDAIDSFYIYREITLNNYQIIGSLGADELSLFEDFGANPNASSYKYKITALDTCGLEGPLSIYHKSIHLQYLGLGNFQWTQYEIENTPNQVASYNVYRDDLGNGNWQILPNGVVPGSQQTYTDVNYASFPNALYRVDVNWLNENECTATRANINTSRSNTKGTVAAPVDGIYETFEQLIQVYPNPTQNWLTIHVPTVLLGKTYTLTNAVGQIMQINTLTSTQLEINLADVANGIYYFQVETTVGNIIKKIVKQ